MKAQLAWQNAVSFVVGLVFAFGLAFARMTQPQKVIGFLNPNNWDPSLLFVMIGAVGLHLITYHLVRRRSSPLLDTKWHVPCRSDLTPRLVLGSALFGLGWGFGGFCPGPGLVSLAYGDARSLMFVSAMIAGMFLFKKAEPRLGLRP